MYKKINTPCHLCKNRSLEIFSKFADYTKITSDCQQTALNANLGVCLSCTTVQKEVANGYIENTKRVYSDYKIYHLSKGTEQQIFDRDGAHLSRSSIILDWLQKNIKIDNRGDLLDFGCGNGTLLKNFSDRYDSWTLYGVDCNSGFKEHIEKINHSNFFESIDKINKKIDLITLIHCLEHIINPEELLRSINYLCHDNSYILIEVPNISSSLFDTLIIDHCTHFSLETLKYLLNKSGFKIIKESTSCVNKEITILAKKDDNLQWSIPKPETNISKALIENYFLIYDAFKKIITNKPNPIGIFGASISGTWLSHEFDNQIDFFVDDDVNKIGANHYNIPIIGIENLPKKSTVMIPMPQSTSHEIFQRIAMQYRCTPRFFREHIIALDLTD